MSPQMRRPPRGQLSIGQTVLLMVLGQGLLQGSVIVGAALRARAHGLSFEEGLQQLTSEPFGPGLAQLFALGVTILVGVRLAYGDRSLREVLRIVPVRAPVALLAIVAGFCLQFPMVELMTTLSDAIPSIARDADTIAQLERMTRIDSPVRAITVPLTLIVIAAGSEELLFRGLLLPALQPRLGAIGALVLTSLLFGVFHVEPLAAIYATLAGLVLGAIALRTRSTLPAVAFHGAFNAVPIVLPADLVPVEGLNVGEGDAHLPVGLVLATGVAGALALVMLWRIGAPSTAAGEPPQS